MVVKVSKKLISLYRVKRKSIEGCLDFVLNSFDEECFNDALGLIDSFDLSGEKDEIKLRDSFMEKIKFNLSVDKVTNEVVELLLWVAILLPEV